MTTSNTAYPTLAPEQRREAYLQALRQTGAYGRAARALVALEGQDPDASVDPDSTFRVQRRKDPAFREACLDARRAFAENVLEPEAIRRAVEGVSEPIFNKEGEQIGERRRYSDLLLRDMLRVTNREEWGNRLDVEKTVTVNERREVDVNLSVSFETLDDRQREKLVRMYRAELPAPQRETMTDADIIDVLQKELVPANGQPH